MRRGESSFRFSFALWVWLALQSTLLAYLLWSFGATQNSTDHSPEIADEPLALDIAVPTLKPNASAPTPIGGVAMTLLLHSPTWFQRRYTFMIENVAHNVPADWVVQIFHTNTGQSLKGLQINRGIARLVERGKVVLTTIPPEVWRAKRKRYELMTERWIWDSVLAEQVLVFGGSSIICSNSPRRLAHFAHFDYIGPPWGAFGGRGGEGGISLRRRSLMLRAIDYEFAKLGLPASASAAQLKERQLVAAKGWGQEDRFFISRLIEMQKAGLLPSLRLADRNDSSFFAATGAQLLDQAVWAVSGTLPGLAFETRDRFLALCPEMKIFFPALHDPHCFGAQPQSEQCAASVCALKPKTVRKGGC
eukprot:gene33219-40192_t